jgi:hypothetical protein
VPPELPAPASSWWAGAAARRERLARRVRAARRAQRVPAARRERTARPAVAWAAAAAWAATVARGALVCPAGVRGNDIPCDSNVDVICISDCMNNHRIRCGCTSRGMGDDRWVCGGQPQDCQ